MKVIVGSSDLWPTPALASHVLLLIAEDSESIGVRVTKAGDPTSSIEEMVLRIAERFGHATNWFSPQQIGSKAGFQRDVDMVGIASSVHAYFAPGAIMEGGTGHVVEAALRRGIPVTAYTLDKNGDVVEVATTP